MKESTEIENHYLQQKVFTNRLEQNRPNPFTSSTEICFMIDKELDITLTVFDTLGSEVAVIVQSKLKKGLYSYFFDGSRLPAGVYYYKLTSPEFSAMRKMVLLERVVKFN